MNIDDFTMLSERSQAQKATVLHDLINMKCPEQINPWENIDS